MLGAADNVQIRSRIERPISSIEDSRRPCLCPIHALEAKATRERGLEYFGVADHSKSAHHALTVEQIDEQHREADLVAIAF